MAIDKLIPAIEFLKIQITGNVTSGSPVISSVASTAMVSTDQVVHVPGIEGSVKILSKTVNTITLEQNIPFTSSIAVFNFYSRFEFQFPPVSDSDKQLDPAEKALTSLSGVKQTQIDYIEEKREVTFNFVTDEEISTLRNYFYLSWAVFGNKFLYYPDKADSLFDEYELSDLKFPPKRTVKKHPVFLYSIPFKFRKVVS